MVVFDEIKFGEDVYKNGIKSKKYILTELLNVAKYLKYNDIEIKNNLIKFCEKHIDNFNIEEWEDILIDTTEKAIRYPPLTGKIINITQSELDVIARLEDIEAQKVLFILLVINKFKNYTIDVSRVELFKLAKVKANTKKQESILYLLNSNGFTEIYNVTRNKKNKNYRKVTFMDDVSDIVITINDFDNIILYYRKYIGEVIIECGVCGVLVSPTNNRQKYCKICWEETNRDQTRARVQRHRDCNALEKPANPHE